MNRKKLKQLSKALKDPTVLPDFPFHMSNPMDVLGHCVCGFAKKSGVSYIPDMTDILPNADNDRAWVVWGDWDKYDNTRLGAAKRIDYLLANGVPESFKRPSREMVELYS